MIYKDDKRGKIVNPARKQQLIDYSGIRYGKITPTDIDGFFEMINELFIFYEFKYMDTEFPRGQKMALERLIDVIQDGGMQAVLLICRHDVHNTDQEIIAADCIVDEYRYNKIWWKNNGRTAKEITDNIIKKILPQKAIEYGIVS